MNLQELINQWHRRAVIAQRAHYKSAVKYQRRHRNIGLWVVGLNAIAGSAVFATLSEEANVLWLRWLAGFVTVSAAVLAGIQTFEKAAERSEQHIKAATQFSTMQRGIERFQVGGQREDSEIQSFLTDFDARYTQLIQNSVTADEGCFRAAEAGVDQSHE